MYIAIDLGGTNARIASSRDLRTIDKIERFALVHEFETDFNEILKIIRRISGSKTEAIGIGSTGSYNDDRSLLISGKNILKWVNVPFVKMFSEEFDCSVFADNDALVAALGEAFYGKGKGQNFMYVTWGTGIGGASIRHENGKTIYQKIDWRKYFEEFDLKCGGKYLAERFEKNIDEFDGKDWDEIMDDFILYLSNIAKKLEESNIILGGGATVKQKERLQKVVVELNKKGINLSLSDLNDEVGLYGAMALIGVNK